MSAALTTDERAVMLAVTQTLSLLGSHAARETWVSLVERLTRLSHCDACGVLFETVGIGAECPHCASDRRYEEALEARGVDL